MMEYIIIAPADGARLAACSTAARCSSVTALSENLRVEERSAINASVSSFHPSPLVTASIFIAKALLPARQLSSILPQEGLEPDALAQARYLIFVVPGARFGSVSFAAAWKVLA